MLSMNDCKFAVCNLPLFTAASWENTDPNAEKSNCLISLFHKVCGYAMNSLQKTFETLGVIDRS